MWHVLKMVAGVVGCVYCADDVLESDFVRPEGAELAGTLLGVLALDESALGAAVVP